MNDEEKNAIEWIKRKLESNKEMFENHGVYEKIDGYTESVIKQILELIENQQKEIEELKKENKQFRRTGKLVINTRDTKVGVILREFKTGQIQVLEKIQPKVINTHDSWKTLELLEEDK